MSINQVRGWMYFAAKILGDVQAGKKAIDTGSAAPIVRRVERRLLGRLLSRLLR